MLPSFVHLNNMNDEMWVYKIVFLFSNFLPSTFRAQVNPEALDTTT